jgi:hypothetical protein
VPYLSPLLFQVGFGLSVFHSGLLLLATAIGNIGMKIFTTPIFRRFGFRAVAVVNGAAAAFFIFACGRLTLSTPLLLMILVRFGYGPARSSQFTMLGTLAHADLTDTQKGSASTLWRMAQQMTIGMGIAFGALCLRTAASFHGVGNAVGPAHYGLNDFRRAFGTAALLTLMSVIGYTRLPCDAGSRIAGWASRRPAWDVLTNARKGGGRPSTKREDVCLYPDEWGERVKYAAQMLTPHPWTRFWQSTH